MESDSPTSPARIASRPSVSVSIAKRPAARASAAHARSACLSESRSQAIRVLDSDRRPRITSMEIADTAVTAAAAAAGGGGGSGACLANPILVLPAAARAVVA